MNDRRARRGRLAARVPRCGARLGRGTAALGPGPSRRRSGRVARSLAGRSAGAGRTARTDPDAGAAGRSAAVAGRGRAGQTGDRQRHHQGGSDQHEPGLTPLLVGAQADRVQRLPPAPERAMPDRIFDVPPGQRGDHERRADLQDRPERLDRRVLVDRRLQQTRRCRQHDDRLVPQVDRVRTHAHPEQRLAPEHPSEAAGRMGAGRDHEHGAARQQHQATLVQERRVLAGAPDQQDDPDQANHAEPVEDVARARHDLPVSARLGQTIASAAPNSIPNARVSVPS